MTRPNEASRPNGVFWSVAGVLALSALAAALYAAHAAGKRRARRWPREAGTS